MVSDGPRVRRGEGGTHRFQSGYRQVGPHAGSGRDREIHRERKEVGGRAEAMADSSETSRLTSIRSVGRGRPFEFRFVDQPDDSGLKGVHGDLSILKKFPEFVAGQLAISENFVKRAGADGLARVRGHDGTSAIFVAEEMMATSDADNREAGLPQGSNEGETGDAGSPAHAAMVTRWMPMNSRSAGGAPATSRQSSMASRMRCVTSSRDRACVWHPGICGTEAM